MGKKYDTIVIGGGISGLIAGLYLQKLEKRSLLLEHGAQVGGNMSGIWRKGFYFDCGDQSTENVGILIPILEDLGLYDPDEWIMPRFRYVTKDIDVPLLEYDQIREDFKKGFPEFSEGLDNWFDYLTPRCEKLHKMMGEPMAFAVDGWKKWRSNMKMMSTGSFMVKEAREWMTKTGEEKALEFFANHPKLQFFMGEKDAKNMPLLMHAMFWFTFVRDYYYPKAGLQGFMNKLADAYQERGGELRLKTTVDKIITSGGVAKAVETSKEERFESEYIINTGNPKRLINEMLDDPNVWDYKDKQIITAGEVTPAVSSAFLGLDMDNEELRKYMKEHHTVYWRTYESAGRDFYDLNAHKKGWCMMSAPSLDLPHLAPKGKSSLVAQVFHSYHWRNGWGTGTDNPFARNQEYKKLKETVLDDIIKEAEYVVPGLSKKIVYKELATPRSMAKWTLNAEGCIMGWTYDRFQSPLATKYASFKTPVKNLYNAGQYSMWPSGVVFSALSGRVVAKGIYKGFWRQMII